MRILSRLRVNFGLTANGREATNEKEDFMKKLMFGLLAVAVVGLGSAGEARAEARAVYLSVSEAQSLLSEGARYAQEVVALERNAALPALATYGTAVFSEDGKVRVALFYFYEGTGEVYGELSATGREVGEGIVGLGEVTFTQIQ